MRTEQYEIDFPRQEHGQLKVAAKQVSNPINRILKDLLANDMVRFNETLEEVLEPQKDYLTETEYQIYQRGKKLRPIMLLLSARMLHGPEPVTHKVIKSSVSLEMLHVATLIHDDIIDDALLRRGLTSVNATRGINTAILVGDLQFVQAIRCFIDAIDTDNEMGLAKLVLDTAFKICCGELDEINTDPTWDIPVLKEKYFEVIERKTAIMFGLACETGMALVKGRTSEARRIGFFGRRVGRAFQIMDDLFDLLQDSGTAGKIRGTDLAQRRVTLPIIYAMEEFGTGHLVSKIIRGELNPSKEEIQQGINAIRNSSAITKAYANARHEALEALQYLMLFPPNRYRDAMEEIALFTIDRSF